MKKVWLELTIDIECESTIEPKRLEWWPTLGKANMVADTLSRKERLKLQILRG